MRLIDADELMEHVFRDKLDSRELIAKMIDNAPTVKEIPTKIPLNIFEQLILQQSKTGEDCVSQEAVLKVLKNNRYRFNISQEGTCEGNVLWSEKLIKNDAYNQIEQLPPFAPKECEDVISRKAAIDSMIKLEQDDIECYGCAIPEGFNSTPAVEALRSLPYVAPNGKTGHWINEKWHGTDLIGVTCSNCHIVENRFSAYCPNCGAKMEVENDNRRSTEK